MHKFGCEQGMASQRLELRAMCNGNRKNGRPTACANSGGATRGMSLGLPDHLVDPSNMLQSEFSTYTSQT